MRIHRATCSQLLLAADTVFSMTHIVPDPNPTASFKSKKAQKELHQKQLPKQVDAIAMKTAPVVLSRLVNRSFRFQLCMCVSTRNEGITHFESFLLGFMLRFYQLVLHWQSA